MSSSLTLQGYHSNCCCNANRPKSCKARGQLLKGAAELVVKQISVIGRGFPRKRSYVLQNHYRVSLASRTAWETKTLKVQGANIPLHYVLSKFPPFSSVAELPEQAQLAELFTGIKFCLSVWLHHLLPPTQVTWFHIQSTKLNAVFPHHIWHNTKCNSSHFLNTLQHLK